MNPKLGAILLVSLVALSVAIPMALGDSATTGATVNEAAASYECTATLTTPPGAGTDGTVSFTLVVTDNNGKEDISDTGWSAEWGGRTEVTLTKSGETATTKTFTGSDDVPYTTTPGVKTVSFEAGETVVCTDTFTVSAITAYEIDFSAVAFGDVDIGLKETVSGDTNMGTTAAPTIKNKGNQAMDVTISATDMSGTTDTIDNVNLGAAVDDETEQDLEDLATFDANIGAGTTAKIDYSLTAPAGTMDEPYSGTTTVTGIVG